MDDHKVSVFRFRQVVAGRELSPQHMWGTREAIASLIECSPIPESERRVHRKLLDHGFFFEHTNSAYQDIEEPERRGE